MDVHRDSKHFCVYHVGGRKGSRGFPYIAGIEHEVLSVLYDADEECVEQAAAKARGFRSTTQVLPLCIGGNEAQRRLFVTYDPNASSLLAPLTDTGLYAIPDSLPALDYPLDETFTVVRTVEVQVHRMDRLCERGATAPDFLSIDVQGTELDVLKGCGELLKNIVGVLVEVEFEPLYREQALFSEVHDFMRAAGFVLMEVMGTPHDPARTPIGARSRGALVSGDALYLRRPGGPRDAELALTSLAFGYGGWAAACDPICVATARSDWQRSVAEFQGLARGDHRGLPPTFAARYSEHESSERFRHAAPTECRPARGARMYRRLLPAPLRRAISALRNRLGSARGRRKKQRSIVRMAGILRDLQAPYRTWGERWGFGMFIASLESRLTSVGQSRLIK